MEALRGELCAVPPPNHRPPWAASSGAALRFGAGGGGGRSPDRPPRAEAPRRHSGLQRREAGSDSRQHRTAAPHPQQRCPRLPALQGAPEPRSTGGPEQIITARSTSSEFALFSFLPFLTLPTAGRSALPSLQRRCSRRSALQLLVGRWGLPAPPDPRPGSSRDRTEPPAPQGRCGHRPGVDLCSQCTVVP